MKHVFTNREKILLVILAVLLIAVGYWKLILTPINDSIDALRQQTASEQDALIQDSARAARLTQMKAELETLLSDPNAKPLPDFDNSEKLLVELNTILSGTDYTLNFANPTPLETGSAILARPISLTFEVSTYSARPRRPGCAPRQPVRQPHLRPQHGPEGQHRPHNPLPHLLRAPKITHQYTNAPLALLRRGGRLCPPVCHRSASVGGA